MGRISRSIISVEVECTDIERKTIIKKEEVKKVVQDF